MNIAILCVLTALFISLWGVMIFFCYQLKEELKSKRILEEKKLLMTIEYGANNLNDILEGIIDEALAKYEITNLNTDNKMYINEDLQREIVKRILKETTSSISPVLYEKLCMTYNKNKIEDIIYFKISMKVLEYVSTINGTYAEE